MELADLTYETAKPLAGTTFEVALPGGLATTLVLETIEGSASPPARAGARAPFSLFFAGPASMVLPQGTYRLCSERATWEAIFIVPIGRDAQATRYQAVFT